MNFKKLNFKKNKTWVYLGGFCVVMYLSFLFIFRKKERDVSEVVSVLKSYGLTDEQTNYIINDALMLGYDLGTAFTWYDFRNWTENDKRAFELLRERTANENWYIGLSYGLLFNRDFQKDIYTLLDAKYLRQLKNISSVKP